VPTTSLFPVSHREAAHVVSDKETMAAANPRRGGYRRASAQSVATLAAGRFNI
jgi:hypothetical protein